MSLVRESLHKKNPSIVVIGDGGVGKTSIVIRYVRDMFFEEYSPTLEDHFTTNVTLEVGNTVAIDITDTAGQEDFSPLRDMFIQEGDAFLVVYSVVDFRSLKCASDLLERISAIHEQFKFVLVGNKCDLEKLRQVNKVDGMALAEKHGGVMIETSCLTKQGVVEVFQSIVKQLMPLSPSKGTAGGCCVLI
jgi:small GTP-binding protein